MKLIDYPGYFKRINEPIPEKHSSILNRLTTEKIIASKNSSGIYNITNLGAVLFCNNLKDFRGLLKKPPRVIVYKGTNRVEGIREKQI